MYVQSNYPITKKNKNIWILCSLSHVETQYQNIYMNMYIHKTYCLVCAPWNISQFQSPKAYCRHLLGPDRVEVVLIGTGHCLRKMRVGSVIFEINALNVWIHFWKKKNWFTNSHNSLPWNSFELIWIIPLIVTIIPVRSQWGRDDLPRYIYIYM